MVTQEQCVKGVMAYYENEICRKMTGPVQFGAYFMLPTIAGKAQALIERARSNDMLSDLFNADGLIDIDAAKNRAADAMQHCGRVDMYGIKFNSDDVQSLYNYIMRS